MALKGADVEELRALAKNFQKEADWLESTVVGSLGRQIVTSPWKGSAADAFRHQWQASLSPAVRTVAAELRRGSQTLTRNAQDQETTSNTLEGATSLGTADTPRYGGGEGSGGSGPNDPLTDFLSGASDFVDNLGHVTDAVTLASVGIVANLGRFAPRDALGRFTKIKKWNIGQLLGRSDVVNYVGKGDIYKAAKNVGKYADKASNVLAGAGFAIDFASQYNADMHAYSASEMGVPERITRAGVYGGVRLAGSLGGGKGGAATGAVVGMALGGPVGAAVGGVVGAIGGSYLGGKLADVVAPAITNFAGNVAEGASKVVGGAAKAVGGAAKAIGRGIGKLFSW